MKRVIIACIAFSAMIAGLSSMTNPASARNSSLFCNGGLEVWSQPSGTLFLIFFRSTGRFNKVAFHHNFGQKGFFSLSRGQKVQIHARTNQGTIDCL